MEFRILGRLEVWDGGNAIALGGPKPRALLALLLLHANEVVPADRLIEELWRHDLPENAAAALQVNLSRIRKALPEDVVATRSPGYVLRVEPDALDLDRFERLVNEGRTLLDRGLPTDASERLRAALSLWTGPALSDFAYERFAQAAIARLEEIRLTAVELRIEADLGRGRHDELIAELGALIVEHPLRERLRQQLMIALYRSGRQAEALDVYKDARQALVDELGIEPGGALQELERAILRQDRSLDLKTLVTGTARELTERAILVAITHERHARALLAVAEPLVRDPPRVVILARLVSEAADLESASAWLHERRSELQTRGIAARAASFTATAPGKELARLATELHVDLLLTEASDELLTDGRPGEQLAALLAETPCDVALLAARDVAPDGAVLVPFGGAEHDWAAVELGAWVARPSRRRCGWWARPPYPSGESETRAACCRTPRSRSNGFSASLPSPCSPHPVKKASWTRAAMLACSSSACRRAGMTRASDRLGCDSPETPPRRRCSSAGACALAEWPRPRPSRGSPGRSAPEPAQLGHAGAYRLPGRNSCHSVRVRGRLATAQARFAHEVGSTFQIAPRPSAWVTRRRCPSGARSICVSRSPAVSVGPIRAPVATSQSEATGCCPATAQPAVRAEIEPEDAGAALLELAEDPARANVPEVHVGEDAAAGQRPAVGAECDGIASGFRVGRLQRGRPRAPGELPDLDCPPDHADEGEAGPIWTECDVPD